MWGFGGGASSQYAPLSDSAEDILSDGDTSRDLSESLLGNEQRLTGDDYDHSEERAKQAEKLASDAKRKSSEQKRQLKLDLALQKQRENNLKFEQQVKEEEEAVYRQVAERQSQLSEDEQLALRLQQQEMISSSSAAAPNRRSFDPKPPGTAPPGYIYHNVKVPRGIQPGMSFIVRVNGDHLRVVCPEGTFENDVVSIPIKVSNRTSTSTASRATGTISSAAPKVSKEERASRDAFLSALPEDIRQEVLANEDAYFASRPPAAPAQAELDADAADRLRQAQEMLQLGLLTTDEFTSIARAIREESRR